MSIKLKKFTKTQYAFTLIELLIVISIIGILSGVLYSIIDVGGVRRRARDSSLSTAAEKMGISVSSYISTYGAPPNGKDFMDLIQGGNVISSCTDSDTECIFTLTGHETPDICGGGVNPSGVPGDCYFYYTPTDARNYVIVVASFGLEDHLVGFSSEIGDIVCRGPVTSSVTVSQSADPLDPDNCESAENY